MLIPLGSMVRIYRQGFQMAVKALNIPKVSEIFDGQDITFDLDRVYNTTAAVYLASRTYAQLKLKRYEKRKQFDETDDILKEILKKLRISGYADIESWNYLSPSEKAFLESYIVELQDSTEELMRKVSQELTRIRQAGLSERQASKELQKVFSMAKARAAAIARTETTRSANAGILIGTYESKIVKAYEFNAVLDRRTTHICESRHGMIFRPEDIGLLSMNTPPLHVNCRSMLNVITEYTEVSKPYTTEKDIEALHAADPETVPQQRSSDVENIRNLLLGMER